MSDQYTRISCGGSPLSKDAPVVGLLFGINDGTALKVMDADDIPTELTEATQQQISLHQAVFPLHQVVGWYRVSSLENHPTAQDVQLTRALKSHLNPTGRFLFSLLQVQSDTETLPLSLYELSTATPVLISTDKWQLETSEPERIAVERVVREQPTTNSQQYSTDNEEESYSAFANQVSTIHQSLQAMEERLAILIMYVESTDKGEIPPNPSLLRQVQGLVCQLGVIMAKPSQEENPMFLSNMAVVAKTVRAVQNYTEKMRAVYESSREPRRF